MPYFLASLAYPYKPSLEAGSIFTFSSLIKTLSAWPAESAEATNNAIGTYIAWIEAGALASMTMLLLGALACWIHADTQFDRVKNVNWVSCLVSGIKNPNLSPSALKAMTTWALGIGLPYYAALQLGGLRTGVVMLLVHSADLPRSMRQLGSLSLLKALERHKFSCVTIAAGILADAFGLTTGAPKRQLFSGYLALFTSLLLLPSPLSDSKKGVNSVPAVLAKALFSRSWMTPPSTPSPRILSPLLSSSEIGVQVFLAGSMMLVITIIASIILSTVPPLSYHAVLFSCSAIVSATGLAYFGQPSTLQTRRKFGVAAGCTIVVLFDCIYHWSSWKIPFICSIWPSCAYLAALFDNVNVAAFKFHDHREHRSCLVSHAVHAHHSKLTAFFLSFSTPGSIMHSILIERDSRRIFYFAW
jgi:zinc transporter 5/7